MCIVFFQVKYNYKNELNLYKPDAHDLTGERPEVTKDNYHDLDPEANDLSPFSFVELHEVTLP